MHVHKCKMICYFICYIVRYCDNTAALYSDVCVLKQGVWSGEWSVRTSSSCVQLEVEMELRIQN